MMELTINGEVYQFNFGMGFLREINKRVSVPVDNIPGVKRNIGLSYLISGVIDRDPEDLVSLLEAANKSLTPRVTRQLLDSYIDDPETDIDALFEQVIDFLKSANATKKTTLDLLEEVERQKAKREAEMEAEMEAAKTK